MSVQPSHDPAGYGEDAADADILHPERKHEKYERLIESTRNIPAVPTAVVWPCKDYAVAGPVEAAKEGIMEPVLVGSERLIRSAAEQGGIDLGGLTIVDVPSDTEAAARSVKMAREGEVHCLMKGSLHTDHLLGPIVARDGLRTGRRISHVFLIDAPTYPEILYVTDAAINIFPDIETKRHIVQNAIDLHIGLGHGEPRVAILSAVEVVNPKIPGTTDAAILCKMADRGQITGGLLDGPLAMDNAIDPDAARIKGIDSPVAGRAQILVVPDLEAGNMLAKNLIFLGQSDAAGIVVGAAVPVILTSRADGLRTRLASAAVGAIYANHMLQEKQALAT